MIAYLGRRLIQSVLILLGISLITFALLYLLLCGAVLRDRY